MKVNQLSTTLIPLIVIGGLAGLTFWLEEITQAPNRSHHNELRHEPDYWLEGSHSKTFSPTGELQYTLSAPKITHFPDDETTLIHSPVANYLSPGRPPVVIQSNSATANKEGNQILMQGQVQINRIASPTTAPIHLTTESLTLLPDEEKAFGHQPVKMTSETSVVHGSGFLLNNHTRFLELKGRVYGTFQPKK